MKKVISGNLLWLTEYSPLLAGLCHAPLDAAAFGFLLLLSCVCIVLPLLIGFTFCFLITDGKLP